MMKVILVIGKICSGKSTFAKALSSQFNIQIKSFGRYLVHYCQENEIEPTRNNLQDIGKSMIENQPIKFLHDFLEFEKPNNEIIIIEGVRHKIILIELMKIFKKCIPIFLDASQKTRYLRYIKRDENLSTSYSQFQKIDNHLVEREITTLKSKCTFVINNENSSSYVEIINKIKVLLDL